MTDSLAPLTADPAAFGRATAALLAARSEHLPKVRDVTALGQRRELLIEQLDGPSLAELHARRGRLPKAEVVTVIISAARAVTALHRAGFCGVVLDDEALRFDADGRPVLLGLGALRETIQAGAAGVAQDWRAVADLAERLGLQVHGATVGALGPHHVGLSLALAAVAAVESDEHVARLEDELFELAEPAPVQVTAARSPVSSVVQRAVGPPGTSAVGEPRSRARAAHRRPTASALVEAIEAGPAALLAGRLSRVREVGARVRSRLHGRARLVLIAVGGAVALTLGMTVLLPPTEDRSSSPASSPGAAPGTARSATPSETASPAPTATAGGDPRLTGADPVAAVAALLLRRDDCLEADGAAHAARAACLAEVSDARASDLDRPARPLAGLAPSLVERQGDFALVALTAPDGKTAPASALLTRTEAGWRLRQLYDN